MQRLACVSPLQPNLGCRRAKACNASESRANCPWGKTHEMGRSLKAIAPIAQPLNRFLKNSFWRNSSAEFTP